MTPVPITLRDRLAALEAANDAVCGARTREQYLSMIDGGQQPLLEALDEARRNARSALKQRIDP